MKAYATCIRFNPYLYKKSTSASSIPALLDLDYKLIFAIGTVDQVLLYSSESVYPLAVIGNTHYTTINDLAWDYTTGRTLLAASSDGYISIMTSLKEMIGERLEVPEVPEKLRGIYEQMEQVRYKRYEEEAREAKKNQFK